ncbi:SC5A9-like protein [Mya arenaria]|uniref:SC5A9-like protein n=1 Tax=Mya arenaria TaxID=6604 RepID=A0ABY7G9A1_MYAAR|nr:SC5A9-like protein [Mya arenaria]
MRSTFVRCPTTRVDQGTITMETVAGTALHVGDIVVIIAYFIFVLVVGLWSARKNRGSAGGYFLAGRNMNWIPVGASLFASNIGSLHFVGMVGSGAAAGISIYLYELNIYLAVLALLVYIFTKISADLYAGAIFIEQSLKWNIYVSIVLLLAVAAIFTIAGGLTAVIWTDFIQTIIMVLGATALAILAFLKVGGLQGIKERYPKAISNYTLYNNDTCGMPREDYMHLFRDPVTGDIPWPGLIGITINSIWYWCSDQTVGCTDPEVCMEVCGSPSGCTNIAYPTLVIDLMPPGARGMMLAVMMSALMSSLTSIFNSSSTIFAMDIWTHFRKKALFVVVLVVISIIWIPVLRLASTQLYVYIQEVSSFLQPPICAIFLLAVFWPRLNEPGAFFGLVFGMLLGVLRFIGEYSFRAPACGEEDTRPGIIRNFHYLYFSVFLFVVTALVAAVVSIKRKRVEIDTWQSDSVPSASEMSSSVIEKELEELNPPEKEKTEKDNVENNVEDIEVIVKDSDHSPYHGRKGWFRFFFNWICGLENVDQTHINTRKIQRIDMVDITEKRRWKIVSNIAAVVCMICMIVIAAVRSADLTIHYLTVEL